MGGAGAAQVAWAGKSPISPAEGSRVAFDGPAEGELWAGRSEWGCYYFDIQELQGPCFTFGGGYTVTVEVDDGGSPDDTASAGGSGGGGGMSDALLRATATLSGGSVHLLAVATDGPVVEEAMWAFVPDEFTTVQGDTTPSERPMASPGSAATMGSPPDPGSELTPGLHFFTPRRAARRRASAGATHEKSHAGRFAATCKAQAPAVLEALVLPPSGTFGDALNNALSSVTEAAGQVADLTDDDFKVRPPCNTNLFPAPK